MKKRLYIHPDGKSAIRSYGYVRNIVYQMMGILEAPAPLVDKKVYYLGNPPIQVARLGEWVFNSDNRRDLCGWLPGGW